MHVSQSRFNVTAGEQRGIDLFKEYFWYNEELCNHCFTRVREIDDQIIQVGKNRHKKVQWSYHERTEDGANEFTPFDEDSEKRYGTTFCLECGSDCSANHHQLSLEDLKPIAVNIFRYTQSSTPLDLDGQAFGRHIRELKTDRDKQGKETQILAVAFSRSLRSSARVTDSGRDQEALEDD